MIQLLRRWLIPGRDNVSSPPSAVPTARCAAR